MGEDAPSNIPCLPDDVVTMVLTFLDVRTFSNPKPVSNNWKGMSKNPLDMKQINRRAFESNGELQIPAQTYSRLRFGGEYDPAQYDPVGAEELARTYGWPMNRWDVSKIRDFFLNLSSLENLQR